MIIESQVFVYNLGTMFYIDDILYPEIVADTLKGTNEAGVLNDAAEPTTEGAAERLPTPKPEIEFIADDGKYYEVLDDEVVTPRVLPVKYKLAND